MSTLDMLDAYVTAAPSDQAVLDLFAGEWSSAMPHGSGLVSKPGSAGLFQDGRIAWAEHMLGGFAGNSILELGPLEGGHSYMLQKAGAKSVVAIEANTRAFLKCLCIKQIFNLQHVEFRLGDINAYLSTKPGRFDAVVASGVLYHMTDPVGLLTELATVTDRLFVWTHYYDEAIIQGSAHLRPFFDSPSAMLIGGREQTYARKRYENATSWAGFCGGSSPHAIWLGRSTIIELLRTLGFEHIDLGNL